VRLLFVYPTIYPDLIGGIEQRNFELASALARRGHQVTLAGLQPRPRPPGGGLSFISLGPLADVYNAAGRRSTRQALRFAARMATLRVDGHDLVETAHVPYLHLPLLAAKCALAGKPLVVSWYEYWGDYWRRYVGPLKAPAYRAVEWMTARLGTLAIASSRLTQQRLTLRRRGGAELVPCGIRLAAVRAAAEAGRGKAGASLVFAGRLLADKRLDLLLRALSLLPAADGAHLTVFGDGPDRQRLQALAAELGLAERVSFRGYVEQNEEVWRALGAARLAVQPSEREGFGLFPLEAMAARLPVVYCASSESAVNELVRDGEEGRCCAPEAPALAATLGGLLADEPARRRLADNAARRAAGYDWDAIAAAVESRWAALLPR
jgi:glycosyltransferase involved in cell wall biosynthesis